MSPGPLGMSPGCHGPAAAPHTARPSAGMGSPVLAEWEFSAVNPSRLFYSTSCEVYLSLPHACSSVFVSQIVPVAICRKL